MDTGPQQLSMNCTVIGRVSLNFQLLRTNGRKLLSEVYRLLFS